MLTLLFAMVLQAKSQIFSDQIYTIDDDNFMPFTRGVVQKQLEGDKKMLMEKLSNIILSWDSIHPPRGFEVDLYGSDHLLEISFAAYVNEANIKIVKGGPSCSIFINDPNRIFGSPVVNDIFPVPVKVSDFHGFPIYQNINYEVTVISTSNDFLYVSVTQEEYLKALIRAEEENVKNKTASNGSNSPDEMLADMEKSYKELLKIDPKEAAAFKITIDEYRAEQANAKTVGQPADLLSILKRELDVMPLAERSNPAYYSPGAMERFGNLSGLIPAVQAQAVMALVRLVPAIRDLKKNNSSIKLLVISWNVGNKNSTKDKPRLFSGDGNGFMLADTKMAEFYNQKNIWDSIFDLVK